MILIFGILVALFLRVEKILENSRLQATVIQVEGYKRAAFAFKEKYGTWPGDLANAPMFIPGCQEPCRQGNGDKSMGLRQNRHNKAVDTNLNAERVQFWKHLLADGLLEGDFYMTDEIGWGLTYPASKITGGFFAYTSSTFPTPTGLWIQLRGPFDAKAWNTDPGIHALTELQAESLDKKLDDGIPDAGRVQAGHPTICGNGGRYDTANNSLFNCDMLFFVSK